MKIRQYLLLGRHIQELHRVGIVSSAQGGFNSPMCPIKKPDSFWRMTVDYRKLNKTVPPFHAAVPNVTTILDTLAAVLEMYHVVLHLANAFFGIPLAMASQDQLTRKGQKWTFQVLPRGYLHSRVICYGIMA